MSVFLQADVETPEGWVTYVVRESAGAFFTDEPITADFAPDAGDKFEAELWGRSVADPMFDVVLERTPKGWVETFRVKVGE